MKKIIYLVMFFVFIVVVSELFADKPVAPFPYKILVADGKYIFVMFEQYHIREYCNNEQNIKQEIKDIVCVYPSAGLYRNDGTTTPLWTVDWYAHKWEVYISSDGMHLVRIGPWSNLYEPHPIRGLSQSQRELSQLVVAFYKNGKLIKEYLISDLVRDTRRLIYSVSHFEWKKGNSASFDDTLKQFNITTVDDQTYIFDIISGKILKRFKK